MTRVTISHNGSDITGIRVSGHSGYAEEGSDIVCAAASVLITTCANALDSVANIRPVVRASEKNTEISVRLPDHMNPQQMHDAQIILQSARLGFQDIAEQYPENLQII